MFPTVRQAVQACHELLLWRIPQLDKFPRVRRFTLGERIEMRSSRIRGKPLFIRFDELTTGFESLRRKGTVIEATGVFRSC